MAPSSQRMDWRSFFERASNSKSSTLDLGVSQRNPLEMVQVPGKNKTRSVRGFTRGKTPYCMARDFRHFGYPNAQILGYANSIAIGKSREADKSTWRMAAVAADVV